MKNTTFNHTHSYLYLLLILIFIPLSGRVQAQTFDGLTRLDGYRTTTYYSQDAQDKAQQMASRCDRVMTFYKDVIGFEPTVTLLVLSGQDWSQYTSFPVYGMPHYSDNQTLIVAAEDNDFWKSFIPPVDQLPHDLAARISATYTGPEGRLTMEPFFDVLAIHELGHAYHFQGGLTMQRKWLQELFANILLHSYMAEKEPELLPALELFPQMVVSTTDKQTLDFTTLQELEQHYDLIGQQHPNNYGWYQCRWHRAAADIYDRIKMEAITDLWMSLRKQTETLEDPALAEFLSKNVHPCVADVQLRWDE